MTVTEYGPHGEPVISNPPTTVADMTALAGYTAKVGNRVIVGNYADMTSNFVNHFGFAPYDGLECFNTDSGEENIYNSRTGQWEDAYGTGPASTNGVFTPASGWNLDGGSQTMVLGHETADVYVSFYREGGTITVPADGNIKNVVVGTLSVPPKIYRTATSGANGRIAHFGIGTSGQVSLTAVSPGSSIVAGDGLSFGLSFIYR